MARMFLSNESIGPLGAADRNQLLRLAGDSIRHGIAHQKPLPVDPAGYSPALQAWRASFVTLEIGAELRGCVGSLEAVRPLARDVAENAFSAAFQDHRFPPLDAREIEKVNIHLSVLSPLEKIKVGSEAELLAQLRPGVDGLLLELGWNRGTFLPAVWASLPDPESFVKHLKSKAGWPAEFWSDQIGIYRYTTEGIP